MCMGKDIVNQDKAIGKDYEHGDRGLGMKLDLSEEG